MENANEVQGTKNCWKVQGSMRFTHIEKIGNMIKQICTKTMGGQIHKQMKQT